MIKLIQRLFATALALCLLSLSLMGQEVVTVSEEKPSAPTDSLSVKPEDKVLFTELEAENAQRIDALAQEVWTPNSKKAMLWAILPGGGQIYNRKYWKLPIVWGAFMTCYYSISWNQRMYNEYHTAYRDIKSEDPSKNTAWLAFAPRGAKPEDYKKYDYLTRNLERGNKFYRRYRDLSIVATVLVYGLSVLDAYVDAELATFDISPDLSLRVSPCLISNPQEPQQIQMGLGCSLKF